MSNVGGTTPEDAMMMSQFGGESPSSMQARSMRRTPSMHSTSSMDQRLRADGSVARMMSNVGGVTPEDAMMMTQFGGQPLRSMQARSTRPDPNAQWDTVFNDMHAIPLQRPLPQMMSNVGGTTPEDAMMMSQFGGESPSSMQARSMHRTPSMHSTSLMDQRHRAMMMDSVPIRSQHRGSIGSATMMDTVWSQRHGDFDGRETLQRNQMLARLQQTTGKRPRTPLAEEAQMMSVVRPDSPDPLWMSQHSVTGTPAVRGHSGFHQRGSSTMSFMGNPQFMTSIGGGMDSANVMFMDSGEIVVGAPIGPPSRVSSGRSVRSVQMMSQIPRRDDLGEGDVQWMMGGPTAAGPRTGYQSPQPAAVGPRAPSQQLQQPQYSARRYQSRPQPARPADPPREKEAKKGKRVRFVHKLNPVNWFRSKRPDPVEHNPFDQFRQQFPEHGSEQINPVDPPSRRGSPSRGSSPSRGAGGGTVAQVSFSEVVEQYSARASTAATDPISPRGSGEAGDLVARSRTSDDNRGPLSIADVGITMSEGSAEVPRV